MSGARYAARPTPSFSVLCAISSPATVLPPPVFCLITMSRSSLRRYHFSSTSPCATFAVSPQSSTDAADSNFQVTLYGRDTITRACSQPGEDFAATLR